MRWRWSGRGPTSTPTARAIQADLGVHLLRTGDEDTARASLDRAFKRDPYDVVTYNLLSMLDSLAKFEVVTDRELVIKLHADEVPVLRESVAALARESIAALAPRYGFTPRGPILIEMFPKHDDFAVRTLGLPGMVGALGACFGRVVTLDSPRARPPGSFNWRATLWHEMAHVFALQLSEQRVPRWVTEGASVFEERRANPSWGREGEHDFLQAYARNELIPLAELNSGFSSARTDQSRVSPGVAGRRAPGRPLRRRGIPEVPQGVRHRPVAGGGASRHVRPFNHPTSDVVRSVPRRAVRPGQDSAHSHRRGAGGRRAGRRRGEGGWARRPSSGQLRPPVGGRARPARTGAARGSASRARACGRPRPADDGGREPAHGARRHRGQTGPGRPRTSRARQGASSDGHTAIEAARKLLGLAVDGGDPDAARQAAERIVALDPFDGAARAELGRQAMARDDVPTALRELELALKLGPRDPASSHTDLAEAYLLAGQPEPARRHLLAALENAPRFERAQELLLKIVDGR